MPPAFNLSQDQTLQFDLEFALRNRSELHFYFRERLRSGDLNFVFPHCSGTRLQTPTLIGCMLLKNPAEISYFQRRQPVISEDRHSDMFY
jgi:hypothetical protein